MILRSISATRHLKALCLNPKFVPSLSQIQVRKYKYDDYVNTTVWTFSSGYEDRLRQKDELSGNHVLIYRARSGLLSKASNIMLGIGMLFFGLLVYDQTKEESVLLIKCESVGLDPRATAMAIVVFIVTKIWWWRWFFRRSVMRIYQDIKTGNYVAILNFDVLSKHRRFMYLKAGDVDIMKPGYINFFIGNNKIKGKRYFIDTEHFKDISYYQDLVPKDKRHLIFLHK